MATTAKWYRYEHPFYDYFISTLLRTWVPVNPFKDQVFFTRWLSGYSLTIGDANLSFL